MLDKIKKELKVLGSLEKAKNLQRFFKTGPGEYGEGDVFLGIGVPQTRAIAKKYSHVELDTIKELLYSEVHEHRLLGLLILIDKYQKNENTKERIFDFYLKHAHRVNNWDLVDLTAHKIVGDFVKDKNRQVLYDLANSNNLWKKRISVVANFAFLPENDFKDALKIIEMHLDHEHDLMHKANGWVLREIGKRNLGILESFLRNHYDKLPRTTLRYAVERFPEKKRKRYLKGEFL